MTDTRNVIVQYCDDVRQEVGNKHSLMGCYGGELLVSSLPAVLPKLCARVQVITPKDNPFSEIKIRAELNDESITEVILSRDNLTQMHNELDIDDETREIAVMAILTFSPLVISEECRLRIFVETEEGEMRANSLQLKQRAN